MSLENCSEMNLTAQYEELLKKVREVDSQANLSLLNTVYRFSRWINNQTLEWEVKDPSEWDHERTKPIDYYFDHPSLKKQGVMLRVGKGSAYRGCTSGVVSIDRFRINEKRSLVLPKNLYNIRYQYASWLPEIEENTERDSLIKDLVWDNYYLSIDRPDNPNEFHDRSKTVIGWVYDYRSKGPGRVWRNSHTWNSDMGILELGEYLVDILENSKVRAKVAGDLAIENITIL